MWVDIFRGFEDRTELSQMIRPLTIACLGAASLLIATIAIWSDLDADSTGVGRSSGDAATTLARATEPRSALTSPSDPLNRDVTAAREEIRKRAIADLAEKKVSDAVEKQVQERARAEALDRDHAAARQEIQTLKVDQANAAAQDALVRQGNIQIQGARLWLEHSVESGSARAAFALAETYDAHMIPGDTIHHLDPNEIASSLRRGDALIASGDLAAARLVLRRAADAGDARAAMTLAETYDPAILEKLGVHGVVPDLAMARDWYERAKKFGATEATQRLELLASKQH
jgi:TPR repeat protein